MIRIVTLLIFFVVSGGAIAQVSDETMRQMEMVLKQRVEAALQAARAKEKAEVKTEAPPAVVVAPAPPDPGPPWTIQPEPVSEAPPAPAERSLFDEFLAALPGAALSLLTAMAGFALAWAKKHWQVGNHAAINKALAEAASRLAPVLKEALANAGKDLKSVDINNVIVSGLGQTLKDRYPGFTKEIGMTAEKASRMILEEAQKTVAAIPVVEVPASSPPVEPKPLADVVTPNVDAKETQAQTATLIGALEDLNAKVAAIKADMTAPRPTSRVAPDTPPPPQPDVPPVRRLVVRTENASNWLPPKPLEPAA